MAEAPEEKENPISICQGFLEKRARVMTARSLVELSLRKLRIMIQLYPAASDQKKAVLRASLRGVLALPQHLVPGLQEELVKACGAPGPGSTSGDFPLVDCFLVGELLQPAVTTLDLERLPTHLRHFAILNTWRAPRLTTLTLALSTGLPWSACFPPSHTHAILAGLPRLRALTLQDLADDTFLAKLGEIAPPLVKLDVQGSLGVTDKGLVSLAPLSGLQLLDVHRTQVSPACLAGLRLSALAEVVSLGAWDDFNLLLEEANRPELLQLRSSSLSQQQIEVVPSCWPRLTHLDLRNINQSYRLHRLGCLTCLTDLGVSGVHYRQSRLGVALLALSPHLTRLSLDHLHGLDTSDLRTIGQHCQVLRELRLSHCTVARSIHEAPLQPMAEPMAEAGEARLRLFRGLRTLIISSNISPSQFLVVTGHALLLETLHTGLSCWLSTRLLSHLLRLNPLEHLLSLRIDNTADLSAPALFLLLQRATRLQEVIGTETWQELDLLTCTNLTQLFDRHHLPHRLVPFPSASPLA